MTKLLKGAGLVLALLLMIGTTACTVEQTEEGNLPEYEVTQTEEGNLPEYDVDAVDVDIEGEKKTIEVPDVDVDVKTKETEVTVPTIEVNEEDDGDGEV